MAAASYTTDLIDFHTIETTPVSIEFTNYVNTGTPAVETDFPIQGIQCMSAQMTKTGLGSIGIDFGSNPAWTTGWNFFVWGVFLPANAVNTDALGGLRILIGSAATAFKVFYVGGRDFGRNPYGGWQNFVVNPELTGTIANVGTPTAGAYRFVGVGIDCTAAIARGFPLGLDAIRYGRGEMRINGGDLANGYATFAGYAAVNDLSTNRWGIFQSESGSYLWKGLMVLGHTTAVDFRDSNVNIIVDNTRRVLSNFNRIEIRQATSRVDFTGVNITALGTTSKGEFEMIAAASVNFVNCTFTGMSTFKFLSTANLNTTTFRRCAQVSPTGATMTNCVFEASSDTTGGLLITTPTDIANMSYCTFTGNAKAIKITTAGTYNFIGHQFANNTVQVDFTGTGICYITPSGSSNVSQANVIASGGGSIVVNTPAVNLTLSGLHTGSEVRVYLGTNPATSIEIGGTESSGTSFTFSHAYGGQDGYIIVHALAYQSIYIPITFSSSDQTIPIQQVTDRNYKNPA